VLPDPLRGGNDIDASFCTGAGTRHVNSVGQYRQTIDRLNDRERTGEARIYA
jgi:hypothetical protein